MKNLKFIFTVLVIIFIGILAHLEVVTRRYDLFEGKERIIENVQIVAETDTQITVVNQLGMQIIFSKQNLTIVKK